MSAGKKTEKIGKIESLSKSGDAAKKQIAILKRWKSLVAEAMLKSVQHKGPRCPDCAGPLVHGEGCVCCPLCGFTRCC